MIVKEMPAPLKDILKNELKAKINGRLWLESGGERFLGPGPVELLERISKIGSISKAAAEMKMSYKKAWMLINNLNAHTTTPVVIPHAGGENGGGSLVTEEGHALISYYYHLREQFKRFLEEETEKLKD